MNRKACGYWDPATGRECKRAARRLLLRDGLGGLCVRYLCAEHSDFEEAPEAALERPSLSLADQAVLSALGVRW